MKKDKMKDFIQDNKSEFDLFEPSDLSWSQIDKGLDKKKEVGSKIFLRIAASLFLILGSTWIYLNLDLRSPEQQVVQGSAYEYAFTGISEELEEVEYYYVSEVNYTENALQDYEVDEDLLFEVEALKQEFENLKEEMQHSADPMLVIEAMIDNYRLRLELLQNILKEMEENANDKNENSDEMA